MTRRMGWYVAAALLLLGVGGALAQTAGKAPAPTAPTGAAPSASKHQMLMPSQLKWGPPPPGLPTAAEVAVLDGNPTQPGFFVIRLRVPDGVQIRPHWHSQDEHVTVISGKFAMGMGEQWMPAKMTVLSPGGHASMPAGERHYAQARGEAIVEVAGMGPFDITYVNPMDDPRKQRSTR
jgi:quercetin dioxygenase-like cupin family protein